MIADLSSPAYEQAAGPSSSAIMRARDGERAGVELSFRDAR